MAKEKKIKVHVSLSREMEVTPDEFESLEVAVEEGDQQMFEEITQLGWSGGDMVVRKVDGN